MSKSSGTCSSLLPNRTFAQVFIQSAGEVRRKLQAQELLLGTLSLSALQLFLGSKPRFLNRLFRHRSNVAAPGLSYFSFCLAQFDGER